MFQSLVIFLVFEGFKANFTHTVFIPIEIALSCREFDIEIGRENATNFSVVLVLYLL